MRSLNIGDTITLRGKVGDITAITDTEALVQWRYPDFGMLLVSLAGEYPTIRESRMPDTR